MKASEVFTPNTYPVHTLVDDHLHEKETLLKDALEANSAVLISGPSKSGKTIFVQRVVGKDNLVEVSGAGIKSPEMLWTRVLSAVGATIPTGQMTSKSVTGTAGGKIGASGGVIVAKGQAEASVQGTWGNTSTESSETFVDLLQIVISDFANTEFTIFVDDFHYIETACRQEIGRQIKDAVGKGVHIICAAVPYHNEDVLRSNIELRGRSAAIDFNYWDHKALQEIGKLGFKKLNVNLPAGFIHRAAEEAAGSPQLMQSICLNSCFESGVREDGPEMVDVKIDDSVLERIFARSAASSDYSSTIEKMRDGPKLRGEPRKSYTLKNGKAGDIYHVLIRAMASDPPSLQFKYQNLTSRVAAALSESSDTPNGSSITGSCAQITAIANSLSPHPILEWDGESDVLMILEPYLLFYLRWGTASPRDRSAT